MRKDWTAVTLGDLTSSTRPICYGVLKPGPFVANGIPLVRITDMNRSLLGPEGMHRISVELDYEFRRSKLRGNEVLLSIQGTVGRVSRCAPELVGANISRTIALIDCDKRVMNEFVAYFLESLAADNAFNSSGSTRASLNISEIRLIEVPVPPLIEQERIVDLLTSVVAYIDELQQLLQSAIAARDAVLADLLSASDDDWTQTTLGEVAKCAGGTAFPHSFQGGDDGIPFVKVSDMNEIGNERFLVSANNYVSRDAAKKLGARVWPKGTVVFAKVGAALLTEKRRVLSTETIFDNNVMGLVPSGLIDSLFLYFFMETIKLGDYVQPGAVPSVNNGIVSEISISLPSLAEQKRIVGVVLSMDDMIQSTKQAITDAKALRSGLLSDLLSGNHEIPASYDSVMGAA
jgi:type I restriction enzyme S subunit